MQRATAYPTVHALFQAAASAYPGNDFVLILPETAGIYAIPAGAITYARAASEVARLADAYAKAGYGHGHRIGLLLDNRPTFLLHWLAFNALGISVVPINSELRKADLAYLVDHSEISLAVTLPSRARDLQDAAREGGKELATTGPDDAVPPPAKAPAPFAGRAPHQGTECALLYTSGTTGRPKGCVLTNTYFLYSGEWYNTVGGLISLRPGIERMINPLPLNHMNAFACSTMAMLANGGCIIQLDRFHPKSWWQSVREGRATALHYLGVMPAMLMGAPPSDLDRKHSVRFGLGSAVDIRQHATFEERFGFPLLEGWAMTETGSGGLIIAHSEPRKIGTATIGRPSEKIEVKIVDDDGKELGPGVPGELLVRRKGPDPRYGFFSEYLKDPEATAAAWEGGYLHTGDLMRSDEDGFLYFVDRKKNVIRRSGENISAVEVETVIRRHPKVREAACAPTPDPVRQDEVLACILPAEPVTEAEQEALAQEIVRLCLDQLAYYKAPGYVAFVEALPLTATQKVQRAELKALAATLPGTRDCWDTRAMKKRQ